MAGRLSPRARLGTAVLAGALALAACRARALAPGETSAATVSRLHVIMINGGGSKPANYQSHLLHVRQLAELLGEAGVPRERITIFSSDGADPTPDLAVREHQPEEDLWLVKGTRVEGKIRSPITYADSTVPGFTLQPATEAGLQAWFSKARKRLRPGDTLLVYVTDHGTKKEADPTDNLITLWGANEALSVRELRTMLARLDPGVRVVTLMSQCFSGAFAHLVTAHERDGAPRGDVCGYFSSTADRMAYGCYPENRGKENVGHSFDFFQALAATGRFPEAHARVLVTDRTPDVPLRSSDVYLEGLLEVAARAANTPTTAFADALLREAWRDRGAWEPDIRLLDRIAQSFGIFSPRTFAELEEQTRRLPEVDSQLDANAAAWGTARADLAQANLTRFLGRYPLWDAPLTAGTPLDAATTARFLGQLADYTRDDRKVDARLALLRERSDTASGAAYRMEVRLAAVLRMRAILTSIAGRVHLARAGTDAQRTAYDALRACEDLSLPLPGATDAALALPSPYPPFDEDVALARKVLPSWMGIHFRQANEKRRAQKKLDAGAASVLAVYPDSPAKHAGIAPGDIILGPPGQHFKEPHQVREWVMLSKLAEPVQLDLMREDRELRVTLVPAPFPLKWPELPGPPRKGAPAPALTLSSYRGTVAPKLADGTPHLLFFWATWCAPCKASLPELLAFEESRRTPIIAITDEPKEQLDKFFKGFSTPFPARVAIDEDRRTFFAYGVTGTPTFVLVDGAGVVQATATGYRPDQGLPLDGWTWVGKAPSPFAP